MLLTIAAEVILSIPVLLLLARSPWTKSHALEWILGWMGVISTSALASGVYVLLNIQMLRSFASCREVVGNAEDGDEGDRPEDCGDVKGEGGLKVLEAMAGLRVLIM